MENTLFHLHYFNEDDFSARDYFGKINNNDENLLSGLSETKNDCMGAGDWLLRRRSLRLG